MARKVDKEVLAGFIEEAGSYLPSILEGIEAFLKDPSNVDLVEEAHRHTHTIKGAASMVGLIGLSHMAFYLEEVLEEAAAGELALNRKSPGILRKMVSQIEGYLEGLLGNDLDEQALLTEVVLGSRRLRGLPKKEDQAALEEALISLTGESAAEAPAEAPMRKPTEEELSPELLDAFAMEADDHLRLIGRTLSALEKDPENQGYVQDIRRGVHTLKGAAGAVGLSTLAQLSHRMEDLLDKLYSREMSIDDEIMDLLFSSSYAMEDLAGREAEPESLDAARQELYARYADLLGAGPTPEQLQADLEPLGKDVFLDLPEFTPQPLSDPTSGQAEQPKPALSSPGEVVRVPLERLDELVRLVSELVINRSVFEQRMADYVSEVEELGLSTERLRRVSSRLETQYEVSALGGRLALFGRPTSGSLPSEAELKGTHDFDELEFDRYTEFHLLSRELSETSSDVRTVSNELRSLIGVFDAIMTRQGRLSSEIQDKLMRTRMVPLATLATRLHRAVRVLAREQGKEVDLIILGENIELDKTVLEDMADPLLHLLRNAVDHGIEPPELRQVQGKPDRGTVRLDAYHEGNEVVIRVSDDGAGLDPEVVRSEAVARGHLSEADAQFLTLDELYDLIFLPGMSTAGEVSEVSGRGVGLDIVRNNVHRQKGTVTLDPTMGQGMTFTVRLPMTLAVARALMVRAHSETFAIPLGSVIQLLRLEREEFERVGQEAVVRSGDRVYPLLQLGEVLALEQGADETSPRVPVLILNAGEQQIALAVDQIIGGREIVIKNLGSHLRRVHGVAGATLMGDGSVVLIINPADLVVEAGQADGRHPTPSVGSHQALQVMIVDDSLSVRRVVSNLIRSAGWQPIAAKDGVEALEILQASPRQPDLVLVDIEMPRMDGYELMTTLRGQKAYRDLPLVVLTSRAGDKHRIKAMEAGASDYVVKPYQDEILLNLIRRLVREGKSAVHA